MKKNQFLLVSLFLIASLLVPAVTGDTQTRSGETSQTLTSSLFVPSASAVRNQPRTRKMKTRLNSLKKICSLRTRKLWRIPPFW